MRGWDSQLQTAAELLGGASEAQAKAVLQTLRKVILKCAYEAGMDAAGVSRQLPPATNEQLSRLITQIVCHHVAGWREELIDTQVSDPRLLDLDWRVDIKTASYELKRMAVPTCTVELQVQGAQQRKGEMAPLQNVAFEMNKEEISAMLQGLEKIRDQLAGVKQ